MAVATAIPEGRRGEAPPAMLGGYAALAEGAWMGAAQASDVLEPLGVAAPRRRWARPRLPRLGGLLTREFSIAEAAFLLMASFFASALLGAVRQILFNAAFGAGAEANAYYAAFRLPDTLFSLIAGGALSSALIPVLLGATREGGEAAGLRLTNLVLTALLAVFAFVVALGELFTPAFVGGLLAPGFDAPTSALTVTLTRIMLLQTLILAVGSVATAVLNSRNQFLLTALSVASHNLALVAGILVARFVPGVGIYGPTWGVVGGAVLQVLILLPGLVGRRFRYRPTWNPADPRLREVVRLLLPNGLAVGVGYAGFILDTAFASRAPERAGLPALQNAWLLVGLPIALLGQAVGQSAFPRLAAQADAGEWASLRLTLVRSLGGAVALALPALLGLLVLGRPVIRVLFEHGKYGADAGALTYAVLVPYAIGLPAYVATEVVTRGLIALRDTRTPLVTNSLQFAGRAVLISLLLDVAGVRAIPLAFAVSAAVEAAALGTILLVKVQRRLRPRVAPAAAA
ncbi:MAG TPA: murein biosynthesis integral membrane protein MurJ [Thermomicrobiales bacterium]|nr:murein biosynthesis integral membrane protein MurJ [Thermomicrobiales bacterium]